MKQYKDLTGQRFGRLEVLKLDHKHQRVNKNGIKKFDDFKPIKNDEGKDVFPVKVNTLDNEMIQDALTFYSKRFHELAPIEHLIKRIDITQSIQH